MCASLRTNWTDTESSAVTASVSSVRLKGGATAGLLFYVQNGNLFSTVLSAFEFDFPLFLPIFFSLSLSLSLPVSPQNLCIKRVVLSFYVDFFHLWNKTYFEKICSFHGVVGAFVAGCLWWGCTSFTITDVWFCHNYKLSSYKFAWWYSVLRSAHLCQQFNWNDIMIIIKNATSSFVKLLKDWAIYLFIFCMSSVVSMLLNCGNPAKYIYQLHK